MATNSTNTADSTALQRLRARLARWRQAHGGPGRRIPEDVWAEAARLAGTEGEDRVARLVGLPRQGLARRVAALEERDGASESFVEVAAVPLGPEVGADVCTGVATVFVVGPAGERMQLALTPGRGAVAGEVVAAFLGALERR